MGGTKRRPYGSTAKTRQMVLAALGVVKVATAQQIRQLMCPGTASAQTVRNGCLDLVQDGLVESLGSATRVNEAGSLVTEKLWNLTGPGLDAAAAVLDRPLGEMGGTARGAARAGAKHARKVTDTIAAFLQTPPAPTRPVPRKASQAAAGAPGSAAVGNASAASVPGAQIRPQGLGRIESWATEVVLPVSGTRFAPGRNSPRADAVFAAPDEGVPLLFVEVDNGTESPVVLSGKVSRYREFFRRTVKVPSPPQNAWPRPGEIPMWQALYGPTGWEGHPPLAIVFTKKVGSTALNNRINSVMRLTEAHWSGEYGNDRSRYGQPGVDDGYIDFTDAVPVLVTTLDRLQRHGPLGAVWFRFGHSTWQSLDDALDDPDAYRARAPERKERRRQAAQRAKREREEEERKEREKNTWVCPRCGNKVLPDPWDGFRSSECEQCEGAEERAERERQQTLEAAAEAEEAKEANRSAWRRFLDW
ncbi:replication-relaxation family protein [Streptomyces sp. YGL11-2]|uniref:replication-relaxation family protein n=1 Tax=Streptomyces sp. YGL11-2 TaxID=3414028 RepID=UPI003CF6867B